MAQVCYIEGWAVQLGLVYAETSFNHAPKGLDFIDYGKWLVAGIGSHQKRKLDCTDPLSRTKIHILYH